jgi:hypothetical protein
MAVIPEDVRDPAGLLTDAMYPGLADVDIDARVQVWIEQGEANVAALGLDSEDADAAVRAWVYYRAFTARAIELASMPASVSVPNEESTTRTSDQRALFANLASEWLDSYQTIVVVDVEDAGAFVPPTGSSPTIVKM